MSEILRRVETGAILYYKSGQKIVCYNLSIKTQNERIFMSGFKRYDEDFKQSFVNLYQTGKIQTEFFFEYSSLNFLLNNIFNILISLSSPRNFYIRILHLNCGSIMKI